MLKKILSSFIFLFFFSINLYSINVIQVPGSGGDAALLNGQPGSFYQNANNINAGTLSISRLDSAVVTNNYQDGDFVVSVTGNVGVGLTYPVSVFHIKENNDLVGIDTGLTVEQVGTGDALVQFLINGTQRWVTGIDNSDSDKFKFAFDTDLDTNSVLTLGIDGRVGIGASSPATQLDVLNAGNAIGQIRTSGLTANTAWYIRSGNTSGLSILGLGDNADNDIQSIISNNADNSLRFNSNNSEVIRINDSQCVGIRTTSPSSNVHINGSLGVAIKTVTTSYNATIDDYTIIVDTNTAADNLTITLPTTSTCTGRIYNIVNAGNTGYDVIITGNISADNFTGGGGYQVPSITILDVNSISVQTDGSGWYVY